MDALVKALLLHAATTLAAARHGRTVQDLREATAEEYRELCGSFHGLPDPGDDLPDPGDDLPDPGDDVVPADDRSTIGPGVSG